MDEFWRASSGNFVQSLKNGTLLKDIFGEFKASPVKAFPRLVARTMDFLAAPVMDYMVPRAKLGVFSNLSGDWLRRNPNASQMEFRAAMTEIWDSVDNRLGQMVYDNVFWNKTGKDLAFLAVRSVGWNLGTVRELGGGAVDTATAAYRMMTGADPQLTHRMAYAFSLPYVVGLEGAMLTYVATGHPPLELMDYFFPPTGGTTQSGLPERVNLPSYLKDAVEFNAAPFQTLMNKTHPLFEIAQELYKNRDYYGALIADPLKPGGGQLVDWLRYFGGAVEPFSLRALQRMSQEPGSKLPVWVSFFGIQPAPTFVTSPERAEAIERRMERPARRRKMREESQ